MTPRPVVVICADDFAISEPVSRVIVALIERGCLNATSCLVEAPAWPSWSARLRDLARAQPGLSVGLHLDLASPWTSTTTALAAFRRQWKSFEAAFGRPPDFIDGHRHVHLFPGPKAALFRLLSETGARPWLRQCQTSSSRFNAKRCVLDPLSMAFRGEAERRGHGVNPGFGGLRRFDPAVDIAGVWRRDLAAMARGGVLMTHPGAIDADDPIAACRAQEAEGLAGGAMRAALAGCGLGMAETRSPWLG